MTERDPWNYWAITTMDGSGFLSVWREHSGQEHRWDAHTASWVPWTRGSVILSRLANGETDIERLTDAQVRAITGRPPSPR